LNGYSNEIKVSICIKSLWENIKIPLKFKVSEAIDRIIQNKDIPGTAQDYNLYKLDRNIPGNKILLNPDEMIHNLINNGVIKINKIIIIIIIIFFL